MNDDKMKELMIDYVEGNLEGELKEFVEKQISKREEIRKEVEALRQGMQFLDHDIELEPDSTLKLDFEKMLAEEIENTSQTNNIIENSGKVVSMYYLSRVAAAVALVITGTFIGWWMTNKDDTSNEIAALKKEMEETRRAVVESLGDQSSASIRLRGVNTAYSSPEPDNQITVALIEAMANDDNTNVRLAAARALVKFKDDPIARKALIDGIATQTDPVVQIELINIMVEMKEVEALEKLKEIINDEKSLETVKDEAHMAVFKLS